MVRIYLSVWDDFDTLGRHPHLNRSVREGELTFGGGEIADIEGCGDYKARMLYKFLREYRMSRVRMFNGHLVADVTTPSTTALFEIKADELPHDTYITRPSLANLRPYVALSASMMNARGILFVNDLLVYCLLTDSWIYATDSDSPRIVRPPLSARGRTRSFSE